MATQGGGVSGAAARSRGLGREAVGMETGSHHRFRAHAAHCYVIAGGVLVNKYASEPISCGLRGAYGRCSTSAAGCYVADTTAYFPHAEENLMNMCSSC